MSDAVWNFPRLNHLRFAAASLALACTQQHQSSDNQDSFSPDNVDELSDDDSIRPRDLVKFSGRKKLQQKFLNRLAEVFARQKTQWDIRLTAQIVARSDADHVTSITLAFREDWPTVHIAKKTGFDDEDKKFLSDLQVWLRAVATSGHRRLVEKDTMWTKLVGFNKPQLEFYVSQLALAETYGIDEEVLALLDFYRRYKVGVPSSTEDLKHVLRLAFNLRYRHIEALRSKHVRLIALLSRL